MWLIPNSLCSRFAPGQQCSTREFAALCPSREWWVTSNGKPTPRAFSWPGWRTRLVGRERLEGQRADGPEARPAGRGGRTEIFAPGPNDPRWSDILVESPFLAPAIKSGFLSVAYGDAVVVDESRTDQLRAIGNGVVALTAAVAFAVLTRRLLT